MNLVTDVPGSIGKIVVNLQSLEFSIRLILNELQSVTETIKSQKVDFMKIKVGEWIPENYYTNYDTLGNLIKKLNTELEIRSLPERVDESIVELRDTIAHGRVLALNPEGPYRILRFSRPKDNKVKVVESVYITQDWLSHQIGRSESEVRRVIKISKILKLNCFPT